MNQNLNLTLLDEAEVQVTVKREDLFHPVLSGNKYRKLKYNLRAASERSCKTLLTFGGAYSNHLLAVAYAGKEKGFKTIGIIRGEELKSNWHANPTLVQAKAYGMEFNFVSRTEYQLRHDTNWVADWALKYDEVYILPEGGSNALGVKGCMEILTEGDEVFDMICCAVGTGATLAGLAESCLPHQHVMGISALKGDFLAKEIRKFTSQSNWTLETSYHFGGYAKSSESLIHFINDFKRDTGILLDPVYTAKLFFGIFAMIRNGKFPKGSKILAIHTGGLQGIEGFNKRQNLKQKTQIQL